MEKIERLYQATCVDYPMLSIIALSAIAIGVGLATPVIADLVVGAGHYPRILFSEEIAVASESIRDVATMIVALAILPLLHIAHAPWEVNAQRFQNTSFAAILLITTGLQLL